MTQISADNNNNNYKWHFGFYKIPESFSKENFRI